MTRRNMFLGVALTIGLSLIPSIATAQWYCDWFPWLCASPRQVVVLEIDQMTGTTLLEVDQTINGQGVSLGAIYETADIDLDVRVDQLDLPFETSLSLADLHALMSGNQSVAAPAGAWKVYALVVTEDEDKPGTLGIMFDFGPIDQNNVPREAFAIFETPHTSLSGGKKPEMLLTTAHEMAHAFNIHHPDWEGTAFQSDSTIEGYSMTDTVRWALSQKSIDHIKNHDPALVVPSKAQNFPFGLITQAHFDKHEADPAESFDLIDAARTASASRGAALDDQTRSSLVRERASTSLIADGDHPLRLSIETPSTKYALGEPVVVDVMLENTGTAAQALRGPLDPEYGLLVIAIDRPGVNGYREFRSPILRNGRAAFPGPLGPGEALAAEAKIFFDANGWNFTKPGKYKIRADFPLDGRKRLTSNEIEIEVAKPATDPSDPASRATDYLSREGKLGGAEGLFLVLGGGSHLKGAKANLEKLVAEAPDAPQADAARVALAQEALRPTINVTTLERKAPNVDRAAELLSSVKMGSVSEVSRLRAQNDLVKQYRLDGRSQEAENLSREIERDHRDLIEKAPSYQFEFQIYKEGLRRHEVRELDTDALRNIDPGALDRRMLEREALDQNP